MSKYFSASALPNTLLATVLATMLSISGCVNYYHSYARLPKHDPDFAINPIKLNAALATAAHFLHDSDYSGIHTTHNLVTGSCIYRFQNHCYFSDTIHSSSDLQYQISHHL